MCSPAGKGIFLNGAYHDGASYRESIERVNRLREQITAHVPIFNLARALFSKQLDGSHQMMTINRSGGREYRFSARKEKLYHFLDQADSIDLWEIRDELEENTAFRCDDWGENANFDRETALFNISLESEFGIFAIHDLDRDNTTYFQCTSRGEIELSGREGLKLVLRKKAAKEKEVKMVAAAASLLHLLAPLFGYCTLASETFNRIIAPASSAASTFSSWSPTIASGGLTVVASMGAVFRSITPMKFAEAIPLCPQYITAYDTLGCAYDIDFFTSDRNDTFAITAVDLGIDVTNITDITNPTLTSYLPTPGRAVRLEVKNNIAFIGNFYSGLQMANLTDIESPILFSFFPSSGATHEVVPYSNKSTLFSDREGGVALINTTDPKQPTLYSSYITSGIAVGAVVSRNFAFVTVFSANILQSFDLNNFTLTPLGTCNLSGNGYYLDADDSFAYVPVASGGVNTLEIVDITDPANMTVVSRYPIPGFAVSVRRFDHYLFVPGSTSSGGWFILDVKDPTQSSLVPNANFFAPDLAQGITIFRDYAFVTLCGTGVQVYKLTCPTTTTSSTTSSSVTSSSSSSSSVTSVTTSSSSVSTQKPTSLGASNRASTTRINSVPSPSFVSSLNNSQRPGFTIGKVIVIALLALTGVGLPVALGFYFRKHRKADMPEEAQNEMSVVPSSFSHNENGAKEYHGYDFLGNFGNDVDGEEYANFPVDQESQNGEYANYPSSENPEGPEEEIVYSHLFNLERTGYDHLSDVQNSLFATQKV